MSCVRHLRRSAGRIAPAMALCGLAMMLLAGPGALADSGQARDMAAGGVPLSRPAGVASVTAATAGSSWSRGMSRAAGAPRYTTIDDRVPAAAVLEKCVTAANPLERYAIFFGRMSALPGASGMAMRIGIEEHGPGESFHPLEAAGTPARGTWRSSEPGVKIFKDVKQVSNLAMPADYRAVVRFRWSSAKGTVIKRQTLRTPVCRQRASEGEVGGEASPARMP